MENNLTLKLEQFLILVSFWRNQSTFAEAGTTEEEKLGFAFQKRRETISAVNPEQKLLLDILAEGTGTVEERLQVIWDKITWKFIELSSLKKDEIKSQEVLWVEIFGLIYPHIGNHDYKDTLVRVALATEFDARHWRKLCNVINGAEDYAVAMLFKEKIEILQLDK